MRCICGARYFLLELNLNTAVRNAEQSHKRQKGPISQYANFSPAARELYTLICACARERQSLVLVYPAYYKNTTRCLLNQIHEVRSDDIFVHVRTTRGPSVVCCAMALLSLAPIESRFDEESAVAWVSKHWALSLYVSLVYVLLVHGGKWWMSDKLPWSLRKPLVMWNTGLAVFSFLGTVTLLPSMAAALWEKNLAYSVCHRIVLGTESQEKNLWAFLFVLFKMVELGDTTFVILRKTPLNFLHWYHHITVMMYCWIHYTHRPGVANWFILLNFIVHSVMYTYYAIKACGYRVPSSIMKVITSLQLSQFVVGILANLLAYRLRAAGEDCVLSEEVFYYGMVMYGSYVILFTNFFYQRYCVKKKS